MVRMLVVFAAGLGVVAACGPASPGASAPGANVVAKHVVTSEGVVVTAACTPTGPELCFNANDDNCNGVIDEGCGVGTGVLQFTVAWGDSPADVDLIVTDPTPGAKVHKGNRITPRASQLEKNCPGEAATIRTPRTSTSRARSPGAASTSSR